MQSTTRSTCLFCGALLLLAQAPGCVGEPAETRTPARTTAERPRRTAPARPRQRPVKPLDLPELTITSEAISLGGQQIIPLKNGVIGAASLRDGPDGYFVQKLYRRLLVVYKVRQLRRPRGKYSRCLRVKADPKIAFQTLAKVLYTANQAQFSCYEGVAKGLRAPAGEAPGIRFDTPRVRKKTQAGRQVADGWGRKHTNKLDAISATHVSGRGGVGFGGWGGFGKGGGGKGGFGLGGRGFGVGKYKARSPRAFTARCSVSGALSAKVIRTVVRKHLSEMKYCYVSVGLTSNPNLKGMVKISFTINSAGAVGRTSVASSTLNHGPAERCMRKALQRWKFPRPKGSMPFITCPFHFKPKG